MSTDSRTLIVVVTGVSGAGKSTAINALEDLGFFCVDNLPTPVVAPTLEACSKGGVTRVGFGIDVRIGRYLDDVVTVLDHLPDDGLHDLRVLYLDASDEALLRRFSSTRRPHPLSSMAQRSGDSLGASAVLDGITMERTRLAPLRARASLIIDTTLISVHDLRRLIFQHFGPSAGGLRMRTRIVSFGFKYGIPVDADIVLDVRFLDNPYFVEHLKDFPGTDPAVREYVLSRQDTQHFLELSLSMLEFCLPRFEHEGKAYLTVAIGCTGGRHRSVVVAEALKEALRDKAAEIEVLHRDVRRADVVARSAAGGG
jgi:UPF0042 nucleotide-binding protein